MDGLNLDVEALPETTFDPQPDVEVLIARSGAKINEQGAQAFSNPSLDEIWLPERQRFAKAAIFYATGLHELVYWTGAKTRLDRAKGGKFGAEGDAFEELIAELDSSFLMADLGVVGGVQHESYIASWLDALKNDKRYIFKAASAVSKAHRFLTEN